MSDFSISSSQRRRLLEGNYKPLVFQGVMDPEGRDPKPAGCVVGARYVLAWEAASATHVGGGVVVRIPRHPTWYLTVTAIEGGPRKRRQLFDRPWVVRFQVTDIRDSDVFLRPGGGDSSVDLLRAGAKPDPQWLTKESETIASYWIRKRLEQAAERGRERGRARLRRAA